MVLTLPKAFSVQQSSACKVPGAASGYSCASDAKDNKITIKGFVLTPVAGLSVKLAVD